MSDTREKIINATCQLLEQKGFYAASINDIVELSEAPKGSLYYYFPEGKDQIAAEAVAASGTRTAERIAAAFKGKKHLAPALREFISVVAEQMERSGFSAGSPLSVVSVETSATSGVINDACQKAYREILSAMAEAFTAFGLSGEASDDLAVLVVSIFEGAILLGRTFHSREPLITAGRMAAYFVEEQFTLEKE